MHLAAASIAAVELHLPATQSMQTSLDCAACVKYLPATQSMHLAAAFTLVIDDHLPATQSIQTPSDTAAGPVLYLPTPQLIQDTSVAAVYLPATQSIQADDTAAPVTA
jgi:hypothetical protein